MKILYIGTPDIYERWKEHRNPSHWLYGVVEMEKDGNEVVWEKERHSFLNDVKLLTKCRPDIIFIPNLNLNAHFLILVLSSLGVIRVPIYAFLHHEPNANSCVKVVLYKFLLSAPRHLFFLSELTMKNCVVAGFVKKDKCSVPGWGADIDFYSKIKTQSGEYFISTGKENRDFDILIEAFKKTGARLKIFTAKSHAGMNYEDLINKCSTVPNIEVFLTENSGEVYPQMLDAMAKSKALVCPLRKDALNYCVGLSTIADAEGLNKPLIITRNPYHETERVKDFYLVDTVEEWVDAINAIQREGQVCNVGNRYSIKKCWDNMKQYIVG